SVTPALQYLSEHGLDDWADEIREMILQHHKVKAVNNGVSDLVELFRKGDLVDFSRGIVRFGLSRRTVDEVMRQYPNAGFHGMLVRRSLPWLLKHPLNPLPMMKW
ncbi:MAG: hypothetical protein LPK85_11540, partial [Gammaproteobacteria bacterium]|nr:hypothetical protein [Gammaproteobacteria bacterium]